MSAAFVASLLAASPGLLLAYIGPGAGLAGLLVAIALVLGVLLLVAGLVWYPLKRVVRARSGDVAVGSTVDEAE